MSTEALELAKKISHNIWESYDDEHGYRSEKQAINAGVKTDNPENIWFFWNQFDAQNQMKFAVEASYAAMIAPQVEDYEPARDLRDFAVEQIVDSNKRNNERKEEK